MAQRERCVHFDLQSQQNDNQLDRRPSMRKNQTELDLPTITNVNHQIFLSPQARRKSKNEIIQLNCAGFTYKMDLETLGKHPTTLLGNARLRQRLYCAYRDEYFIDRHRPTFETVVDYFIYG